MSPGDCAITGNVTALRNVWPVEAVLHNAYIERTKAETEIERLSTEHEKTGVFSGTYAINPFTEARIPIWIDLPGLDGGQRGLIVGEITFGKGLVQTVYPLAENTGLALTTARYYTPSGRLIQRDYSNVSLYDYYYNRDSDSNNSNHEVKLTDGGRTVYGGGGITPDVNVPPVKSNHFQDTLLQHYAFFNFAKHYLINRHIPKTFEVDDQAMLEFRSFLTEQKISWSEAELAQVNDWIRAAIKSEMFIDEFGQIEGLKIRADSDPQVQRALELLPKAKELADNARRSIAERNSARNNPPSNR